MPPSRTRRKHGGFARGREDTRIRKGFIHPGSCTGVDHGAPRRAQPNRLRNWLLRLPTKLTTHARKHYVQLQRDEPVRKELLRAGERLRHKTHLIQACFRQAGMAYIR